MKKLSITDDRVTVVFRDANGDGSILRILGKFGQTKK